MPLHAAMGRNAVSRRSAAAAIWLAALGAGMAPSGLVGQLTSPGELSLAHADWDGRASCAQCHERDGRSTTASRCLSCHTPLAARIAAGEGSHAARADDCASCHREHRGRAAGLVRFEPAGFDHGTIGYPLAGGHADLDCAACHNTRGVRDREVRLFKGRYGALTRTHLGLEESCVSCHASRDPHAGQFEGRECAACHAEMGWTPASVFDHAGSRYPLTGRHRGLACESCHRAREATVEYRPLSFGECSSCHRDSHAGEMGRRCASCHSTSGWTRIPRARFEGDFDHADTAFPLEGRHASAPCTACHRRRAEGDPAITLTFAAGGLDSYPRPELSGCASCHLDYHEGALAESADGPECASCHTAADWSPSTFDAFAHERGAFRLTGAHRMVPCADCHAESAAEDDPARFRIRLGRSECASCHRTDDPHAGQFGDRPCESCHTTGSFAVETFDHDRTRFPLDGAHEVVPCASCHTTAPRDAGPAVVRYRPLDTECRACHAAPAETRTGRSPEGSDIR